MVLAYPRAYSPGVLRALDGDEPTEFDIDSGVARLRVPGRGLLVLHQRPPEIDQVLHEADRLLWLDGRGAAPRLVATGRAAEGDEAVMVELADPATLMADGLAPVNPEALASELARVLRHVHELPIDDCPFESASELHFEAAKGAVERGEVERATEGPYVGRSPTELVAILGELLDNGSAPGGVFVHGGLAMNRIWLANDGGITFTGWDRAGVGDRHLDLAALAVSLGAQFGPAVIAPFLGAYGLDGIDLRRLDAHQLLVHLMP